MTARLSHTSFDAIDAYAQSVFWGRVLGFTRDPDEPDEFDEPGDEECMIFSPDGSQRILFIEVPEAKRVKNRLHLDLVPARGPATRSSPGCWSSARAPWTTSAAPAVRAGWCSRPEGNEFCILRSEAERATN